MLLLEVENAKFWELAKNLVKVCAAEGDSLKNKTIFWMKSVNLSGLHLFNVHLLSKLLKSLSVNRADYLTVIVTQCKLAVSQVH